MRSYLREIEAQLRAAISGRPRVTNSERLTSHSLRSSPDVDSTAISDTAVLGVENGLVEEGQHYDTVFVRFLAHMNSVRSAVSAMVFSGTITDTYLQRGYRREMSVGLRS